MKKWFLLSFALFVKTGLCATDGGTCGDDCNWTFDASTHTLTVTGTKQDAYGPINNGAGGVGGWHTTAPWAKYETQIEKAVIADTFDTIKSHSFYCVPSLKEVVLPQNLTKIESQAFHNAQLTSVDIPNTVIHIGTAAFQSTKLQNVVIPDSVETIGNGAFGDISTLESIVIGDGVKSIGENALRYLPATAKIYCQDTAAHQCDELINDETYGADKVVKYTKDAYGRITVDGKTYRSAQTLAKGVEMKRIYTIEEASKTAGKKNKVLIRYR